MADAWRALLAAHPVLARSERSMRFALNGAYTESSTELADGDELALIPPVAGGELRPGPGGVRILALCPEPIDEARIAALRLEVAGPLEGAVALFIGQTRTTPGPPAPGQSAAEERGAETPEAEEREAEAGSGARGAVVGLQYEAFETMALAVLGTVADEIEARFGVRRLAILHRTGWVPLGHVSVVIAAAAPHRAAAFDACRYAIDELKARAPIWKAEHSAEHPGGVWVAARAAAPGRPEERGKR